MQGLVNQKRELALWRVKNPLMVEIQRKGRPPKRRKASGKAAIAAAVKFAIDEQKMKTESEEITRAEERKYIMSLIKSPTKDEDKIVENTKYVASTVSLAGIIKKAKK